MAEAGFQLRASFLTLGPGCYSGIFYSVLKSRIRALFTVDDVYSCKRWSNVAETALQGMHFAAFSQT